MPLLARPMVARSGPGPSAPTSQRSGTWASGDCGQQQLPGQPRPTRSPNADNPRAARRALERREAQLRRLEQIEFLTLNFQPTGAHIRTVRTTRTASGALAHVA